MKRLQLGLVVEGNSTGSALLRLPAMAEELGPIKAATLRVARRLSNFLRAGYAVSDYEELQAAKLILLRVPDSAVPRIVDELCASELAFSGLSFVLCESWLFSDVLDPLRARGASVATLVAVPSKRRNWFVVEGQPTAMRQVRRLIERNDARTLELHPNTKQLCFAAQLLSTTLPQFLFITAQNALRAAGITGNHLHTVLNEMATEMLRAFLKGARVNWSGPLTDCSAETAKAHFDALRQSNPQIAELVEQQLSWVRPKIPSEA